MIGCGEVFSEEVVDLPYPRGKATFIATLDSKILSSSCTTPEISALPIAYLSEALIPFIACTIIFITREGSTRFNSPLTCNSRFIKCFPRHMNSCTSKSVIASIVLRSVALVVAMDPSTSDARLIAEE